MPSEAQVLKLPLEYEFEGEIWKIEASPISFGTEAAFARWVFTDAERQLDVLRQLYEDTNGMDGISQEKYDQKIEQLNDRFFAGEFNWGTKIVSNKATQTWEGVKYLLYLRMKKYNPKVEYGMIERIFANEEAKQRLNEVLKTPTEKNEKGEEKQKPGEP